MEWTNDEDLILAEITLRRIRLGSTQLDAFEEVAERIGRTPQACGTRWNAHLRHQYEAAIQIAKAQRAKRKPMSEVERLKVEIAKLEKENSDLRAEVKRLKQQDEEYTTLNEDYQALICIMERAKRLAFAAEEEERPKFRMTANGNLERLDY